jgi:hypothetical protein
MLLGVLGAVVAVGVSLPPTASLPTASADPPPPQNGVVQAAVPQSQLDAPLRLIAEARQTYTQVQHYNCTLISQERIKGRLGPENVIAMTFRAQPFSVYMRWLGPKELTGQEVAYVHGRNNGMMRVHSKGVIGALGFMSIAPNDPRVLEHSRHTIVEAGIGNLIERLARTWEVDRFQNRTQVQLAEYDYNQRRCIRVETIQTERTPQAYSYRTVVYFDKQWRLPVRVECYDFPRPGGPAEGELLECFSYANPQFNTGIDDRLFNK